MAIKDYEIIKQIGSGGMGAIFLARDPRLDRLVAIKKTRIPNNLDKDIKSEIIQRFYREAKAIANLNHPNIVTVYDLGQDEENNECYMVMEYLEGKSIELMINEQKTLSLNLVVKIGIQVCEALNYLHQKGLVHRDIKPANIIYCDNGMIKIIDFGLVRVDDSLDLTRAGTILGSILYMSPEQIKNPKDIDHKVDIYALGVTLFQALSGSYPYEGNNPWDIIRKITLENPISLSELKPDTPYQIEQAIMKAISKSRIDRYSDISLFQNDLADYNNIKIQTIISPLSYVKGTGKLPPIEDEIPVVDKTVIYDNNNNDNKQSNTIDNFLNQNITIQNIELVENNNEPIHQFNPIQKNSYKADTFFSRFKDKLAKENINIENNNKTENNKSHEIKIIKDLEENSIKLLDYPSVDELFILDIDTKNKVLKINDNLLKEIKSLILITENINTLISGLKEDISEIDIELRGMINKYNLSIKQQTSNLNLKDLKRKIEYKKSQKNTNEKDLELLKDKFATYDRLLKFKNLRVKINKFILNSFENNNKDGFFEGNSIFEVTQEEADKSKEIFIESIDSVKNIVIFMAESEKIILYLKNIITKLNHDEDKPIGKLTKIIRKNSSLEIVLSEECDNNSLLEIELSDLEILFTYCQMVRNDRPVPRFQTGDTINIFSNDFNESVINKINRFTNIYKMEKRSYKKDIFEKELEAFIQVNEICNVIEPFTKNTTEKNFEQLIEMFSEIGTDDEINVDKKQSCMIKLNKIKKSILDLKKHLEEENEEIKNYGKYINPILISINKYPSLLKAYEDNIKSKKEYRKKYVNNILLQINKSDIDNLKKQKDSIIRNISVLKDIKVPDSVQVFLKFYILSKAKLPTELSKNQLLEILNNEKDILSAIEIDWICKIINVNFSRDKGFTLKNI